MKNCPDCGATPGSRHVSGCDVERCPVCKGQMISCRCVYRVNGLDVNTLEEEHPKVYAEGPTEEMWVKFDQEADAVGGFLPWTGEWPGVAECRERGWFCQDGHGANGRFGSFCPCPPDAPGAMPDLNRWAHFNATGRDDLYEGCGRKPRGV